ncbi:MAG: hypothetical protein AB7Q42_02360 [Acidimicrobiia bacterium]
MVVNELPLASNGTARPLAAIGAMTALAVLDLVGAVLARKYADHRSLLALIGGCFVFGVVFWVYGKSLAYAELATVTFGWVVMLQVGVVLLDRFQHGAAIPPDRIVVMFAIVMLQGYLLLAP